jgi:hypothetical protein
MICGKYIPETELTSWNFPHIRPGRLRTLAETLTEFLLTCQNFHSWQHNIAAYNNDPCVKIFKNKWYNGHKHRTFYNRFLEGKQ